jgi:hypothetical protein
LNSKAEALARDKLDAEVKAIEQTLPPLPTSDRRRIAVNVAAVKKAKRDVVELCRAEFPDQKVFQHEPSEDIHPMRSAGRVIDDSGIIPLQRIWRWFACERDGWLFSQPYYAANPDQFKRVNS